MSLFLYRKPLALQSRTPSMMLAWLSSSEIIASSGVEDRLEHAAVGIAAGVVEDRVFLAERSRLSCASSSLWSRWVPQMKRTDARP